MRLQQLALQNTLVHMFTTPGAVICSCHDVFRKVRPRTLQKPHESSLQLHPAKSGTIGQSHYGNHKLWVGGPCRPRFRGQPYECEPHILYIRSRTLFAAVSLLRARANRVAPAGRPRQRKNGPNSPSRPKTSRESIVSVCANAAACVSCG